MDGVSWSATRAQESFSRSRTSAETLTKLASFIAHAETKQHRQSQRQQATHIPTYVCQECGKGFPYATDLVHHQNIKHALPKPHRCPSCGQEFSLKSSLQLHKCSHDSSQCKLCHGELQLGSPCPACVTDPGRPQDQSPHHQPHPLDSSPYACAPCGRGFSHKQALLHHQQAGCSEPPSPLDIAEASSTPFDSTPVSEGESNHSDSSDTPGSSCRAVNMCHFCSKTFRTEGGLQHHKHTNHTEEQLMTPLGPMTKGEGTGGEAKNLEQDGDAIKSEKKVLNCRSCDMVFRSTSKLYLHREEKHSRETNIRREPRPVKSKRRKDSYPCQICGKVFFHHLSLRAHYRQHTASSFLTIKDKCPSLTCTKDSELAGDRPNTAKPSLNNKTVKASAGRPKKHNQVTDSERHREVPEEEEEQEEEEEGREFPCPSCVEVFSQQSHLREHVELHQSSVKRRQCSVCTSEMDTCKWVGSKRQRLYHCVPCQQGFSALDSFLEHCQEHLRVRVEQDSVMEGYTHQASKA